MAVAFLFLFIGLFHVAFPYASWFMSIGWKIQDAKPSDAYMILSRIVGGLVAGIALIVIIVGFIHAGSEQAQTSREWSTFKKEMTVSNISSIQAQYGNTGATPAQIKEFVNDLATISDASPVDTSQGGGFSAMGSFVVTCNDGYVASIININDGGSFGMAKGNAWLAPDYEFTSTSLLTWADDMSSAS